MNAEPFGVVSVVGMYRTGKSYLMNRVLLNRGDAFGVGPTVNPCTKGLWMWDEVISINGKKMLVLDSEGLGAFDQEVTHDMKIFCMAVLASSTLIYNSVGSIDEGALETLALASRLAHSINHSYLDKPYFIWVVRDFSLKLVDCNDNHITSQQYLEKALAFDHLKDQQKVQSRKIILDTFSQRDCITMIKPLINEQKLQELNNIPSQQLRPQFLKQSMELREKIINTLKTVKINNNVLTGKQYVVAIKQYLNAINSNKIPNLHSTWQYLLEDRLFRTLQQTKASFQQRLKSKFYQKLPMPLSQLQVLLHSLQEQTLKEFKNCIQHNNALFAQFVNSIQTFCLEKSTQLKEINKKQGETLLQETVKREFQPYYKKLQSEYYADSQIYQQELRFFKKYIIDKYSKQIDGVEPIIHKYIQQKIIEGYKYFETKMKKNIQIIMRNNQNIQQKFQKQIFLLKQNQQIEQNRLQQIICSLQKKCIILATQQEHNTAEKYKKNQEHVIELNKIKKKYQEQIQINELINSQIIKTTSKLNEAKKQTTAILMDFQCHRALWLQKQNQFIVTLKQYQQKCNLTQNQILKQHIRLQNEKKYLLNQNDCLLHEQNKQIKQLKQVLQEWQIKYYNQNALRMRREQQVAMWKRKSQEQIQVVNIIDEKIERQRDQYRIQCAELQRKINEMQQNKKRGLEQIKQSTQQLRQCKNEIEHKSAIYQQKLQFHSMELKEVKQKYSELKKSHQKCLELKECVQGQDYQTQLILNKQSHMDELNNIKEQYQNKINQLKKQISALNRQRQQYQLQYNLQIKKYQNKQKQYNEQLKELQQINNIASQKLIFFQHSFKKIKQQKQLQTNDRIKQLEKQFQLVKEKAAIQIQQNRKSSEEALTILKNYSEMQRVQWDKQIRQERQKTLRRQIIVREEEQKRFNQERSHLQDVISDLQHQTNEAQKQWNDKFKAVKYEYEIKLQKMNNCSMEERMQLSKRNALLTQQLQLNKIAYETQIQERKRQYEKSIQIQKKQWISENEQMVKKFKEQVQFIQGKAEAAKKGQRKAQEGLMIYKSEQDKEKLGYKEREKQWNVRINELQTRLAEELIQHTKIMQQTSYQNSRQRDVLNNQILKFRDILFIQRQDRKLKQSEMEQKKNILQAKNTYLDNKLVQKKQDYNDLLKKLQTVVAAFKSDTSRVTLQKQYQEVNARLKADCQRRVLQKQQIIQSQIKDYNQKIYRLQSQNKNLKDRLLLMEVKEGSARQRHQEQEVKKLKDYYQKKIQQIKVNLQKQKKQLKRVREQKDQLEMKSDKNLDRSLINRQIYKPKQQIKHQRSSFIDMENSQGKVLGESKTINLSRRYSNMPVKKQQKTGRQINIQNFEGIMRYQQ